MKGKLIVIEGTDGAGKATQTKMAYDALLQMGKHIETRSFPNYGAPACAPVEMYLHGEFGKDPREVSPYAATALYVVDQFASFKTDWQSIYENGGIILCDRYTTSNAIHQASALERDEQKAFWAWLEDFSFTKVGLPKPDLVLFLDVPVALTAALMKKRAEEDHTKADIMEANLAYQHICRGTGMRAAEELGWKAIQCFTDDVTDILPAQVIHKRVMKEISKILKEEK